MENNQIEAPGRKYLKVTGVLYIIFAAFGLVVLAMALLALLVAAGVIGAAFSSAAAGVATGAMAIFAVALSSVSVVYELIMGIMGVKHCANLEKAKTLVVMGIIAIALQLITFCVNAFGSESTSLGSSIFSLIIGLVLPTLYLIGALKNKKANEEGNQ